MLVNLKKSASQIAKKADDFLFGAPSNEQLGLFRFFLCGTLFYLAIFRQMNIDLLGVQSLIPRGDALNIFPDFYRPLIQWFFWPDIYVGVVHGLLAILLLLAALGLTNRPLLMLTWIIHQGILNRNYSMLFGADVIGGLFLFYLSFTKCTNFFSLKNILFKKSVTIDCPVVNHNISISSIFYRLMQFQICTIYMYTGFEKLKGTTWWQGTALWTVFANPQFSQYDLKFLSHVPMLVAIATFMSLIFEIYFPAMMLNNTYRKYWLAMGVAFHLAIGLLLGLMTFSMVMLSTYILFLQAETIRKTIRWILGFIPRRA